MPKGLEDLLADTERFKGVPLQLNREQFNRDIIEAYRRGQKAGNK